MALNSANFKSNQGRDIKYLSKDFASFRKNLVEYSKTYFPKTYSDFNESSPGMMFIEMASYLGDILSYYTDDSLKESLMLYAEDKQNVIALANYLGYKPKVTAPAIVQLSVYQLAPAVGSGEDNRPDSDYYLRIKQGMVVESSKTSVRFRTTELVDFNDATDREITVYTDDGGEPTQYLIKKYVKAVSGELKTVNVDFGSPEQFSSINIADKNVIDISDVRDTNGGKWYEVPYLAQEMVYVDYPVSEQTDKDLAQFKDSVSNVLKVLKTSKRFVKKINQDNTTSIVFGGGNTTNDEQLVPNLKNVGLGLNSSIDKMSAAYDPANFLKTTSYGQAPSNTTMTVSYLVGGGVESNVGKGELTSIKRIEFDDDTKTFAQNETTLYNKMKSSVAVDNEIPATGGRGEETIDEIRENALANFGSQNRAVTRKDYQVRALSLPPKYGGIAKAFCSPDGQLDNNSPSSLLKDTESLDEFVGLINDMKGKDLSEQEMRDEVRRILKTKKGTTNEVNNPFAINLYILGYNSNKNLSILNRAVKENLKTYIGEYRMLTDGINIIDGYIINIGLDFEIRVYGGYNKREVLTKCITELKEYFNIDNWTFNMPINISEVEILIAGVEGVQSVPKCEIFNKCLGNYSEHSYDIKAATKGKMVYPSVDPSVFEVKFPNKDIKGRVV
tara:strand:+ start:2812 stop:4824 length:2013 start_codon:yes stop_codon:yes gene_type:complete